MLIYSRKIDTYNFSVVINFWLNFLLNKPADQRPNSSCIWVLSRTDEAWLELKIDWLAVIDPLHWSFRQPFREECNVWTSDVIWRLEVRILFQTLKYIIVSWTVSSHKFVFLVVDYRKKNVDPSVEPRFSAWTKSTTYFHKRVPESVIASCSVCTFFILFIELFKQWE